MKLKHGIAAAILGVINGMVLFGVMNSFDQIRGFQGLLITATAFSLAFATFYLAPLGKIRNAKTLISITLAVLAVSLATFTLILGSALKAEQGMWIHVEKIDGGGACIPISDEDLNRSQKLKKAIEEAMSSGSGIVKITNEDLKGLGKYYGKCVSYNGQEFEIMLAVT